jgi:hypothetical protein
MKGKRGGSAGGVARGIVVEDVREPFRITL